LSGKQTAFFTEREEWAAEISQSYVMVMSILQKRQRWMGCSPHRQTQLGLSRGDLDYQFIRGAMVIIPLFCE
jgi:hypothetical protein